ncbi:P-loop NTPase fold protein [Paenibacillus sp. ClWae2A]|uniref:P-loop NTPase fold protein n=1 Tax=Paenibacillus sp. ClWae2A TaxID=3057177 RepID=UPI0028F53DA9|nr:P-loop NTPase fold protein [Paenibacillus sp. ClWae2A]MDT9720642.1 P-loop NTPase fold protein [Paenibacillus sp. ClWae2A]
MRKSLLKITKLIPFTNPSGRKKISTKEPLYLQDSPVTSRQEDKFQYGQMADIIYELLEEGQLPLHIGLMGSWGTGKTSVLRLLETKVKAERKNDRKYLLKFINVWKFADDAPSLHRKIVREVEAALKVKKNKSIDHTESTIEMRKTSGIWSIFQRELWKKHGFIMAIYSLTLILITILYEWIFNLKDAWALSFTSSTTLLIIMIGTALLNKSGVELTYQTTKNELALQHGDQFEHRFESAVSDYLKANKGKKLILVFDDLDRLPPKQLVAALNTIKTFLRSKQCAFIVPCDEEVLLEGISSAFTEKKMSNLSVSEFLNKTFDLQLHLPHVEKVNMRSYAKNLLSEQRIRWTLHENMPVDRLLGILIHTGIRTPRQVKKILNAYAFDWYLAFKRDAEAGVNFLRKHPNEIAIFTVLKTDFPNYYHYVSQNPLTLRQPIEEQIRKLHDNKDSLPEENEKPDESAQLLEAFLSRVKGSMPTDPRPFIYFNNQLLNPLTGRPELENTKELILNGQTDKFSEEFTKLSDKDKHIVLSSTLEDTDTASNIFAENVLKVLFEHKEALNFIAEIDINRWEKIIVENIDSLHEFDIVDICTGLEYIQCSVLTWEAYGQTISKDEYYEELFNLWVKYPHHLEKLGIPNIGENIIQSLHKNKRSYIAGDALTSIPPDNSILDNQSFDWIRNLKDVINSKSWLDEPLANWLSVWAKLTGGKLSTSLINKLLSDIDYEKEGYVEFLDGLGALWCELFVSSQSKQSDMNALLEEIKQVKFTGFTQDDFKGLENHFSQLNYKTISNLNYKIFKTWWENDQDKTIELMGYWKNSPGVAGFAGEIFSFELERESLALVTSILTARSKTITDRFDHIISVIKDELRIAKDSNRASKANVVIDELITDSLWSENLKPLVSEIYPSDKTTIWLHWPPIAVEDRANLLVSFLEVNQELAEWVVNSVFDLYKVRQGALSVNAGYRSHHTNYMNTIIKALINNESIDWNSFLQRAVVEKLLDFLDSDAIDSLVITLGRKLDLNNDTYIDFFITHHSPESEFHRDIAIGRWDFFNPEDRKTYLDKYDSTETKHEFGMKLADRIQIKPSLKYIDELGTWNFNDSISQQIVKTTIQKVDDSKLNSWFQNSIVEIIKELDRWTIFALFTAVRIRNDLVIPKRETLDTLLLLKDERSILSLNIVKKNKTVANALRNSIGSLKDTYPDEVEEVKKEFKWRKL